MDLSCETCGKSDFIKTRKRGQKTQSAHYET